MEDNLEKIRHSLSHILAEVVLQIFPNAKLGIGPVIENGFYYDFELPRPLNNDDLIDIENKMKKIISGNHNFLKRIISKEEARLIFKDQPYKLELINEIQAQKVTIYIQDNFTDLCKGPHVINTKKVNKNSFKLLSIAGAYWKGNEKNNMLQRIYGTGWEKVEDLKKYLNWLDEIEKRDHRKIGKELDLFSLYSETGPGLIYWHPKGARIRYLVEEFWHKEHYRNGYEIVYTPHIGKSWLWQTSGHLDFYNENMYSPMKIDNQDYYLKPMNCPFHIMIYKSSIRSYKDLPIRWAELGTVYRYERSGVLHGLLRVRGFTQDDAHIICTPEQIESEIREILKFSIKMWRAFGFEDIIFYLATKPEKSVGNDDDWEIATESLKKSLTAEGLDYIIDEKGGAFYGPKIDFKVKDAIGRRWQVTTIQFDFNLPHRFNMKFVDKDGKEKKPYMVHRALLGSMERFFGILIEHYNGAFPVWLSPIQAIAIPVTSPFNDYAIKVVEKLKENDIRAVCDLGNDRLNAKIKKAQKEKIPYMLVLGEKEQSSKKVSIRNRKGIQFTKSMREFIEYIGKKVRNKELI